MLCEEIMLHHLCFSLDLTLAVYDGEQRLTVQ